MASPTPVISNCLWFDDNAEEAVNFYKTVFLRSAVDLTLYYGEEGFDIHGRPPGSVMLIDFELYGVPFQALNGGPVFRKNPSVSFFIMCDTPVEADKFWKALVKEGKTLMPFDKYEWSEAYGWLEDKYGVSWQIYTGDGGESSQKIIPMLMYSGKQHGKAKEAIEFYTSVFPGSRIEGIMNYPAGGKESPDHVMHAQFHLANQVFMAMDGGTEHAFGFSEGISLVVNCRNQQEIEFYWERLLEGGGQESQCGWLKDRFGMSWQVVPVELEELLDSPDVERTSRVTKAFLQMKKPDINQLRAVFEGNHHPQP